MCWMKGDDVMVEESEEGRLAASWRRSDLSFVFREQSVIKEVRKRTKNNLSGLLSKS